MRSEAIKPWHFHGLKNQGALDASLVEGPVKGQKFLRLLHIRNGVPVQKTWPLGQFDAIEDAYDAAEAELSDVSLSELKKWVEKHFSPESGRLLTTSNAINLAEEQVYTG